MQNTQKKTTYLFVLVPILTIVASLFVIGFIFSVYVSTEYEKHNEQLRFINIVASLAASLEKNHETYFSTLPDAPRLVLLQQSDGDPVSDEINAHLLNREKAFIRIDYGGDRILFFKGISSEQAEQIADQLPGGRHQQRLKQVFGADLLFQQVDFSQAPPGRMAILSSVETGKFVVDFVFDKLWPFLLVAAVLSFLLSIMTYQFIRSRYGDAVFERTRFGDFAEASSDWFWEMDENLRFSYFSDRFTEVTGVPQSKLLGVTREENGNPGATEEAWQQQLSDLRERRAFKNFVHPRIKPGGEKVWLSINGKPVFDKGRFTGFRGVGRDITSQIEIERKLSEAKEEAEKANRIKSEFLANMSHELRTPLNAIIGFSQMMIDEMFGKHTNTKYREYSTDICESAYHLLALINDVLDISKIESGEMRLDERLIDLPQVIEEACSLVEAGVNAKKQTLRVNVAATLPKLRADRRMVKQVLLNLLSNAYKFTPEGGTLTLDAAYREGEGFFLSMADTGIGISKEDLNRVLVPFNQAIDNSKEPQEGTGLGLSLAKKLMELHEGSLTITSELEKGTVVRFTFPPDRAVRAA